MRLCIRVLFKATLKTALPEKKGGGAPTDASNRVPHPFGAAHALSPSSPIRGGGPGWPKNPMERARSPFGAPPRHFAEVLPSTRPEPALPGTTGCKREDPLRHQCSELLAVRHWAGRAGSQAARVRGVWPRPREPPPLRLKEYPREGVLRRAGFGLVTWTGTFVTSHLRYRDEPHNDASLPRPQE
jgi:hypothetical protein